MKTKTFVVAIVLATALSVASCSSNSGNPIAPNGDSGGGGGLGTPSGGPLPGAGSTVRLVDSDGRESLLVATMGDVRMVSCGSSAPAGRYCVQLGGGSSARFDRPTTNQIASNAHVELTVSRDCSDPTHTLGSTSLLLGEEKPIESSSNGGTDVLDYRPCGTVFDGVYRLRDTPGGPYQLVSVRGVVRFQ